jgi:putative transposase
LNQKPQPQGILAKMRIADFVGQHFWARGYFVSTVGRDEQVIREYMNQEQEDKRLEQLSLWR